MNSHADIQKHLSAYCGEDLAPAEALLVEKHLAECPECRADLADLQTALRLLRTTPEIEPPPWLTGRIMANVREQQEAKQSWLKRIFFPLHIKLPLEAIALVMVCVSGYYLSRTVETDLKESGVRQFRELPAQLPVDMPPKQFDKSKPQVQPVPVPAVPADPTRKAEPAQIPQQNQFAPTPHPAIPSPSFTDDYGAKSESVKAAPAAETYGRTLGAMPEYKMKSSRKADSHKAAASPAAAAAPSLPALLQSDIRLSANDPASAPLMIREAVIRSGGSVMEGESDSGQKLKIRITAARQDELLSRLEKIGKIVPRPATVLDPSQLLEMTILW